MCCVSITYSLWTRVGLKSCLRIVMMNGVAGALPLFSCTHADCGATFTREWKLNEHLTVHTGEVCQSHRH